MNALDLHRSPKSRVQKCHWGYTPRPLRQQEWAIIQYQVTSAMWLLGIGNWGISGISDLGKALLSTTKVILRSMADVDRVHSVDRVYKAL